MTTLELQKAELPEQIRRSIEESLPHYPTPKAALVPALMECQKCFGCVTPEVAQAVAELTGVPYAEVASVVSFYTMILTKPVGQYVLGVCRTWNCEHAGARELIERFERKFGARPGETAARGLFTLIEVECLCDCGNAPSVQVVKPGRQFRCWWLNNLTPDLFEQVLDEAAKDGDDAWRERLVRIEEKANPPDDKRWIWLVTTNNQYPAWIQWIEGKYAIFDAYGKLRDVERRNPDLFLELQEALRTAK